MWITAALDMQYTPMSGSTRKPAIEAMLTIRPRSPCCCFERAIICLATACATKKAPLTLVSNM